MASMSGLRILKHIMPWLGVVLATCAFLADIVWPLGAVGVCYVLAILTTFGRADRRVTLGMAVAVSAMALAAWGLSGAPLVWPALLDLGLTLSVIWAAAFFLVSYSSQLLKVEAEAEARKAWLAQTLASIGDGVIATDKSGRIEFMNKVAERLTGWGEADAVNRPIEAVFDVRDEATGDPMPNPIRGALEQGDIVDLTRPATLRCRRGVEWPIDDSAAPIRNAADEIVGAVMVFREIRDRRQQELQTELRLREAGHRIRNVFANVRSILSMCERAAATPTELLQCFDLRMASLVRSSDRLLRSNGRKSSLWGLIVDEVEPYLDNEHDRLQLSGDDVLVGPRASVSLAMIIHELATNASKHGSLAERSGRIEITCRTTKSERIALSWAEFNGRQPSPPEKAGLGTTLIEGLLRTQFDGSWEPTYGEDGFKCRLELQLPPEPDPVR